MDSPRESINPRAESRTNRTLWLDWLTRQQAVAELLGYSYVTTEASGRKFIARRTPQAHPDWPTLPVYASEASEIVGEIPQGRSPGDVGAFDEARTTLTYTTRRYEILTDDQIRSAFPGQPLADVEAVNFLRYVEVTERPQSGYLTTLDNMGLVWSDDTPFNLKAFVITYHTLVTVKWVEIPLEAYRERTDPLDPAARPGFLDCIGFTNSVAMGTVGSLLGFRAVGTMLQGCPSKELYRMPSGAWAVDVTIPYRFDPYGSNAFYRHNKPGGPGYDTVKRPPPGNQPLYPSKDLTLPYVPV